jgi:anti-anti-sigma factor
VLIGSGRANAARDKRRQNVSFDVAVEHLDGTVLVCPIGELDLLTAPELERVLDGLSTEPVAVVIDLSGLTFVDCAGLVPVRAALRDASLLGRRVRLSGARPSVDRVLELTGLREHVAP